MPINIKEIEKKWQQFWKENQIYKFDSDHKNEVYSIDNPPRYASGALHIGHATHYTHIDIIARYKKMRGFNVFFPLCFDVNGMPIEVNVEKKYKIKMSETDRHEFIKLCEDFANSMIQTMIEQFELLGESMDSSIYYQTDAPYYRRITQLSFLEMAEKGLVYRGEYPITWCPRCKTAIAESEINYSERKTKLNYVKFKVLESELIIATTRPEMIPACVLIAVHPDDKRYKDVVGKIATTPLFNKQVKIVADPAVEMHFGTGVDMVCTIGDKADLEFIYRHNLPLLEVIDEDGKMTELAGIYKGLNVEKAREEILKDLAAKDLLVKQEDIMQNVGSCWRCDTPIELIQKKQWFLKTLQFKKEMLEALEHLNWYPEFMKKRLIEWIQSLQWDWVISRQRYFATPIPAWECENGHYFFANPDKLKNRDDYIDPTKEKYEMENCPECSKPLSGVTDVFDTWMDSSISPLYNTFWNRDDDKFRRLYPMSLRAQAHDIIRTWGFYTLYRCGIVTGSEPWKDVFIDGYILASDGRPMHASWGNVIDPLEIIEESGTDTFRYFTAQCTIGEDTPFRNKEIVRGSRLIQKIWNIGNFIKLNVTNYGNIKKSDTANNWIIDKYSRLCKTVTEYMDQYRYDRAIKELEIFLWHDLADNYLEMIKARINDDTNTQITLYEIYLGILKMFAPVMPHITEELYQELYEDKIKEKSIHLTRWPSPIFEDPEARKVGEIIKDIVSAVRKWKSEKGLALSEPMDLVTLYLEGLKLQESDLNIISGTLHIKDLRFTSKVEIKEKITSIEPNFKMLGPLLKSHLSEFKDLLKNTDPENIKDMLKEGWIFHSIPITEEYVKIKTTKTYSEKDIEVLNLSKGLVLISYKL